MVKGDWGFSFNSRVDVDKLIIQRLPVTLFVIGSSQLLALLIALPVGVFAATRPYSIFDQLANTFAFVGFSLPTFFTGILFILLFSIKLDWLPFVFRADISETGWRWWWVHAKQSIMPIMVLGLFQGATRLGQSDVARGGRGLHLRLVCSDTGLGRQDRCLHSVPLLLLLEAQLARLGSDRRGTCDLGSLRR